MNHLVATVVMCIYIYIIWIYQITTYYRLYISNLLGHKLTPVLKRRQNHHFSTFPRFFSAPGRSYWWCRMLYPKELQAVENICIQRPHHVAMASSYLPEPRQPAVAVPRWLVGCGRGDGTSVFFLGECWCHGCWRLHAPTNQGIPQKLPPKHKIYDHTT